jgi:hypothetical protein
MYTGILSSMGSSILDAMGHSVGCPWSGSRIRPDIKDDAADEGYKRMSISFVPHI